MIRQIKSTNVDILNKSLPFYIEDYLVLYFSSFIGSRNLFSYYKIM